MDISITNDWHKLSKEQQADVQILREDISKHIVTKIDAFLATHPDLSITSYCTVDPLIRANHGTLVEL